MGRKLETINIQVVEVGHAAVLAGLHALIFGGRGEHEGGQPWSPSAVAEILSVPGAKAMLAVHTKGGHTGGGHTGGGPTKGGSDEPVGFAIFRVAADEGEIILIGVVPAARRCGVGARLLDQAVAHASSEGAAKVYLEVAEDNPGAISFYQARGFAQTGLRNNYYRRGKGPRVHARILCRKIDPES